MGIPEFLIVGWLLFSLGFVASRHGQPRERSFNGWAQLIVTVVFLVLLYWAGLFN